MAADRIDPAAVVAMMHDVDPVIRRYGAIVAKRLYRVFPHLMTEAELSNDPELRRFYQDTVGAPKT